VKRPRNSTSACVSSLWLRLRGTKPLLEKVLIEELRLFTVSYGEIETF